MNPMSSSTAGDLRADDLEIGTRLVWIDQARWDGRLLKDMEMRVVHKTKTQLTIGYLEGHGSDYTYKVRIVGGTVLEQQVGKDPYHNRISLYTPDDPDLVPLRAAAQVEDLRSKAHGAVDRWRSNRSDLDRAREVRDAFAKYIEAAEALPDA